MKITKYGVLRSDDSLKLTNAVKKHIGKGWQPFGGISNDGDYLYQTMVVYEETVDAKDINIDDDFREKLHNCIHHEWEPHPTDVGRNQCKNCGILFRDGHKQCYFPFDKCPHKLTETTKSFIRCRQCGTIWDKRLRESETIDKTRNNE